MPTTVGAAQGSRDWEFGENNSASRASASFTTIASLYRRERTHVAWFHLFLHAWIDRLSITFSKGDEALFPEQRMPMFTSSMVLSQKLTHNRVSYPAYRLQPLRKQTTLVCPPDSIAASVRFSISCCQRLPMMPSTVSISPLNACTIDSSSTNGESPHGMNSVFARAAADLS